MTVFSEQGFLPVTAGAYERGAERLLEAVVSACDPQADFAARVEAGLSAGLSLFAADPGLARLLVVRTELSEEAIGGHRRWQERCATLLREAAASLDLPPTPPFLERLLIAGVFSLIAEPVHAGKAEELGRLLPDLLEFVLVFYADPARGRAP